MCKCVHGLCNSGLQGDGTCECYTGYTGPNCDTRKSRGFLNTKSGGWQPA